MYYLICNEMRTPYVLSFLFFGYDLHYDNNNNNNFNTHHTNTCTCPTTPHTTIYPRYHAPQTAYCNQNANCHFNHIETLLHNMLPVAAARAPPPFRWACQSIQ